MRGVEVETALQGGGWMDGMGYKTDGSQYITLHCNITSRVVFLFYVSI